MMVVKGKCDNGDGGKCFAAVMDIVSAVASLADYLEKIVANCDSNVNTQPDACVADVVGIVGGLAATASTASTIKETCTKKSTRLYQVGVEMPTRAGGNLMS